MSKKSRRSRAKRQAKPATATKVEQYGSPEPAIASYKSPTPRSSAARSSIERYWYVLPELRRIGIIAGSIILILIVLSFVLG
ncbi:MAG: hypothetical protein IMY78_03480 [Chloroflexi bacterium]|jgi:hypothetical protein|nr:hypothetical protein [Chloroflexota bacterium]